MPSSVPVRMHPSQFPQAVRRDLLVSLRSRRINHKFLYDSYKLTQRWLALHMAYSPSRTDPDCSAIYDQAFVAAASRITAQHVHLVGLGCGGGQKDARLLNLLRRPGRKLYYTPCDVSPAMALVAHEAATRIIPDANCFPFVTDLASIADFREIPGQSSRLLPRGAGATPALLFTFFGMLPNFEPRRILPRLAKVLKPNDWLLLSANLAPGRDYAAGVRRVLPLYDNKLTRDWLMTFLLDLGIERKDGRMDFVIENDRRSGHLLRITAYFRFSRKRTVHLGSDRIAFTREDAIRVFFSNRHTPPLLRQSLLRSGLRIEAEWVAASGEEGVFLCRGVK